MSKFYEEIYKLKNLLRKGWLIRNASSKTGRVESDAEHTFSMALLAMEIMNKSKKYSKLNRLKVYEMILVHELCEIDAGDHTPFDGITKQDKYDMELKCVQRISNECDMPSLLELWKEFEENKTAEAQFVKKIDRLDAIMQAKVYSEEDNKPELYEEFKNFSPKIAEEFEMFE